MSLLITNFTSLVYNLQGSFIHCECNSTICDDIVSDDIIILHYRL